MGLDLTREIETGLPDSRVSYYSSVVDHRSRLPVTVSTAQLCRQMSCLTKLGVSRQAEEVDVGTHQHKQASLDGLQ